MFAELEAAADTDVERGLEKFDALLMKHIAFGAGNFFGSLFQGLTLGQFNSARWPVKPLVTTSSSRMSKGLALCADVSMLMLGGDLKRKEMISARLGDVLSHLYLASATSSTTGSRPHGLRSAVRAVRGGAQPLPDWQGVRGLLPELPEQGGGAVLKRVVFPFGVGYKMPTDDRCHAICLAMMKPGEFRDRLTALCYVGKDEADPVGLMERAFQAMVAVQPYEKKLVQAQKRANCPANWRCRSWLPRPCLNPS